MGKTEKYTLHKTGDGPKVCAFYATEKGCKTGASCKFVHGEIPAAAAPTPVFNSHFDTSSEDDSAAENDTCTKPLVMTPAKKKKAAPKEKVSAKSPAKAKSSAKTKSSAKAVTDDDDDDIFVAPSSKKTKKRTSISAAAAPSTPSTKKARTVPAAAVPPSPPAPVAATGASPAGGGATLPDRLKEMEDQVGLDGSGAILGRVASLEEVVFGGGHAPPSRMLLARVAALETNLLGEVPATVADAHMSTAADVGSSAMKKKERKEAAEKKSVQISTRPEKKVFDKSKPPAKLHEKSPKKTADPTAVPSFRSLAASLPVAAFSLPYEGKPEGEATTETDGSPGEESDAEAEAEEEEPPLPPLPDFSTTEGNLWAPIVRRTRAHPHFRSGFCRPHPLHSGKPNLTAKPYGKWCEGNPHVIAIDCEMCLARHSDGKMDPNALCRISVVNGVNPEEVLLDTLVKPDGTVVDYRSWINGISEKNMRGVAFTLDHARDFMLSLLSDQTVVVGHSVKSDLAALNIMHGVVADSALLFRIRDSPRQTPSLGDLSARVLDKAMPETHDSVNDARTALLALERAVGKDLDAFDWEVERVPGLIEKKRKAQREYFQTMRKEARGRGDSSRGRSAERGGRDSSRGRSASRSRDDDGACCLLVHRIPKRCTEEHLSKMFAAHIGDVPAKIPQIEFGRGNTGKVMVKFESKEQAASVFEGIEGKIQNDAAGAPQKRVYLKNGGYINIRGI